MVSSISRCPGWILVAAIALSACGGEAAPAAQAPQPSAPASAAAKPSAVPSLAASKPAAGSAAGSAKPAAGAAGGPIKIGVLEPLTQGLAPLGKDNQDGLNLYLESIKGTLAGRQIQLSFADTQGNADVGLNKAKQLVENEGVKALMGITATPVAYAVAGYVQQAHIPLMITENGGAQALTSDPKFKSPYLSRFTQSQVIIMDPPADWAYKHGWHKAIAMGSDYAAGLENVDAFASTFLKHGGTVVQEMYPPQGTSDFGPYFAQLKQDADFVFAFFPGIDGVRFVQQIGNYASRDKLPILDVAAGMTGGSVLADEKDKAVGIYADNPWSSAADNPANQAFLKAWEAKYPGRYPSADAAMGYSSGQILQAALEKVQGNIEDTDGFLKALYATDTMAAKGPIKLDANHDVIENLYVYQLVQSGDRVAQKLQQTYENVSSTWDRTPDEVAHFPFGKLKGQWVGMTQAKVEQLAKGG